jgi:hypothetical protein
MEVTARKRAEAEALQRQREAEVLAQLAQANTSLELDMVLQRVAGGTRACGSERDHLLREPTASPGQSLSGGLSADALHELAHRTR